MEKLFKSQGFTTAIRIDRINGIDKVQKANGQSIVRVFLTGMDSGYELNFDKYDDLAEKAYEDIVKAVEED